MKPWAEMTEEDVLALEPGAELDALVATHVMGWRQGEDYPNEEDALGVWIRLIHEDGGWHVRRVNPWSMKSGNPYWQDFRPSKDIAAAWEVKDRVGKTFLMERDDGEWDVIVPGPTRARGATATIALCRAALLAAKRGLLSNEATT